MHQLKERIRNLIMQNETDAAVDTLLEWSKVNYLSIYDQCVLLRAWLEQTEREANTNLIGSEDAMRQVNQVNAALLHLISDLDGDPVEQTASIPASITTNQNNWLVPTLIGALILAIGAALYFFFASPTTAIAASGKVRFPEGKRVALVDIGNEIAYEILDGRIEPLNPQQLRLVLQIRCLPKTTYRQAVNFWSQNFRLECPNLPPFAPANDLNIVVEHGSYRDGSVEFLLPVQTHSAKLTIQFGSQTAQLSLVW